MGVETAVGGEAGAFGAALEGEDLAAFGAGGDFCAGFAGVGADGAGCCGELAGREGVEFWFVFFFLFWVTGLDGGDGCWGIQGAFGELCGRSGRGVGCGAGFEGGCGAGDAEGRVPPHGVYDVVPEVLEVVDRFFGVEDAAVSGEVLELERGGIVLADCVAEVEAGVGDVEFDVAVLGEKGCGCGVYGGGKGDVAVEKERGVGFGAAGAGGDLHGSWFWETACNNSAHAGLMVHQFDKMGAGGAASAVGKLDLRISTRSS